MKKIIFVVFILHSFLIANAQIKVLFDASKAEMAGNADWIIDADLNNISYFGGPPSIGGSESNPQRFPTPAQSGITITTTEDYWTGAISAWAVDCAKLGYIVETLPYNGLITYGVSSNPQDLSNYKVYIIDEPNIAFTSSEKDAIINFVKNGGGLFMVSDHDTSDRNNDGIDSPSIFNDLMANNAIAFYPFGIFFDLTTFSQTSTNVAVLPGNLILNGTFGNVTSVKWSSGTSMTLNTSQNATVKGLIYKNGASTTGTTNVMCSYATYFNGKVVAIGDSSPTDDGTGDVNDNLFFGYSDLGGNHQRLLMNATKWLASTTLGIDNYEDNTINCSITPNPINNKELNLRYIIDNNENIAVTIYDIMGRMLKSEKISPNLSGLNSATIALDYLNSGIYLCKVNSGNKYNTLQFIIN